MDDELETDVEDDEEEAPAELKWSWLVFLMRLVEFVRNLLNVFSGAADVLVDDIAAHLNHKFGVRSFQDGVREDIEAITASAETIEQAGE